MTLRQPLTLLAVALLALLSPLGCGSRTPPGDEPAPDPLPDASASPVLDAALPPRDAGPDVIVALCYQLPRTAGCTTSRSGGGRTCRLALDCEGHRFEGTCTNGLCRCENVGTNSCFCELPASVGDACGITNCCFRR